MVRPSHDAPQDLGTRARWLDLLPAAVVVTDERGDVIFWNRGAEVLFGWDADLSGRKRIEERLAQAHKMEAARRGAAPAGVVHGRGGSVA